MVKDIEVVKSEVKHFEKSKVQKINRKISFSVYPLSIYHSTRLFELITNIYGFDMFGLILKQLFGIKGSKN